MDPRRFNAMYNGEFEKMHGLVYDCLDEALHIIDPVQLPQGTKYYAGVDWGYTHPFVIVVRAVTPAGEHYQVSEFYKAGLTVSDMVQAAKKFKSVWDIQVFTVTRLNLDISKSLIAISARLSQQTMISAAAWIYIIR
jgi:hypothetical protein